MFKIGDFSRIARVSCRLLRYYDELGLLKPAIVDATSGYRFYSAAQLTQLNRILVLKELGLSLEQIAHAIADGVSSSDLRAMLTLRRSDVERTLAAEADRLRQIEARIAELDAADAPVDDVRIRSEPAHRVLTMRRTSGSFAEVRDMIRQLAQQLPRKMPPGMLGAMIAIAHSTEFEPDVLDVELGFVVRGNVDNAVQADFGMPVQIRELAATPYLAACVRVGLPENAHRITSRIGRFAEANGYALAGPSREMFLKPPQVDRMEEAVVEMQFPLQQYAASHSH
jgi:DNA-binding transcriptional MerR regulator